MPPLTPRTIRGVRFMGSRRAAEGSAGRFLLDELLLNALLGGGIEDSALLPQPPANLVLLELGGGEAGGLQWTVALQLRPGAPHELLGASGDQEDEAKLAVHSIRHRLDHSLNPSSMEVLAQALENAGLSVRLEPRDPNHAF